MGYNFGVISASVIIISWLKVYCVWRKNVKRKDCQGLSLTHQLFRTNTRGCHGIMKPNGTRARERGSSISTLSRREAREDLKIIFEFNNMEVVLHFDDIKHNLLCGILFKDTLFRFSIFKFSKK